MPNDVDAIPNSAFVFGIFSKDDLIDLIGTILDERYDRAPATTIIGAIER
jgi:hypothetical protein